MAEAGYCAFSKAGCSVNITHLQVYITGHGGDGFMKFQDKEEVTSDEIGKAFAQVKTKCLD